MAAAEIDTMSVEALADNYRRRKLFGISYVLRTQRLCTNVLAHLSFREVKALGCAIRALVPLCRTNVRRISKRIHVCCGTDGRGVFGSIESLDPSEAAASWEAVTVAAPLSPGRSLAVGGVLRGCIFVCGGWNGSIFVNTLDFFDPPQRKWVAASPMHAARGAAAGAVMEDCLYVCGGRGGGTGVSAVDGGGPPPTKYLDIVERFDPERNSWESLLPMTEARSSAACGSLGGSLYVCGGYRPGAGSALASAEKLGPGGHGAWETLPPMVQARVSAACGSVQGHLFVCGGTCGSLFFKSVERFDCALGSWCNSLDMLERRSFASTCPAAGRLFVFGGFDGANYLNSVESYDHQQNRWDRMSAMTERRAFAIAALGDPLVVR